MPFVSSEKYNLRGEYAVKELTGKYYTFTQDEKDVIVPESDIDHDYDIHGVEGFLPGHTNAFVKSIPYNLYGNNKITEHIGKYYRFTKDDKNTFVPKSDIKKGNKHTFVPKSDIKEVEGYSPRGGMRRNHRATKRARRNRRSYSRRN